MPVPSLTDVCSWHKETVSGMSQIVCWRRSPLVTLSCVDVYGPHLIATLFFGSGFEITVADVYPAFECGPKYRRREPRWISACFPLIAPKASMLTLPIHTSGSRSNGFDPFPSPGRCCNIPEIALLMSVYRYGFQLNDTS